MARLSHATPVHAALPTALRTAIATAVKPEHTTTDIQYLCATSQFNAGAVPTPKEISKANFDAITTDATTKIVDAIQTDTSAAVANFMSAFERQDGYGSQIIRRGTQPAPHARPLLQ